MGFRYRKSKNLGKGFRVNMSKTGPGFSWGGKGFRLTRTAKGNIRGTAYIPGTGLSYQKEFANPLRKKQAKAASKSQSKKKAHTEGTTYTNDLSNIRSSEMGDVVDAKDKARFNKMLAIIAIVAGIGLFFLNPYFIILSILGLIFYIYSRSNDKVKIDYDMTKEAKEELAATNDLLAGIMESDAVWLVTETEEFADDKEADMRIISRIPLSFRRGNDEVDTNAETFTLEGGPIKLIFLPDSIFIKQNGKLNALGFNEIQMNMGKMTFLEDERVPNDATLLGNTYEHTNKDGSPDKRYKENKEVAIVEYGFMSLYKEPGLDTLIVFSDTVLDGK